MLESPRAALEEHFGFKAFRPGQQQVIERLLAGHSAVAVFPTGAGKSLCYQLPALMLPGLTLVVSPLIALMKDQTDALAARGIAAQRLDSTLDAQQYRSIMEQVRSGRLRLLYVSPERFNNERFREAMRQVRVSLIAIDEVHCISEWGHNFRPDYLKLARYAEQFRAERVLGLTATATPDVLADICRLFQIPPAGAVRTGFYRPNLTLLTTPVEDHQRDVVLLERLRRRPGGATIVYVTLQRTAETVADRLQRAGLDARAYHAGLEDATRVAVQDWFLKSASGIVVATIAFGMGVDKPDIRYVYHYNHSKSLESYSQEIGRAGRDALPSICETLVCPDDINVLENFVYGDTPSEDAVRGLVAEVFAAADEFDASVYELSNQHDIRLLVVQTLLTYLELLGYLEGGTPFYASYKFKPALPSRDILARFEGERREFLAQVFRQARPGRTWLNLDVHQAAAAIGTPRERIVRALEYLAEQELLELQTTGVRLRYRRIKMPADVPALAQSLYERMLQREVREVARLHRVLEFVAHDGCQVSSLGAYFGEPLGEPCGHCSWCLQGRRPVMLPERPRPIIDEALWRQAVQVRRAQAEALTDPRSFARFLCGVSSPQLSRAKLTGNALFGALGHVPFQQVLDRAISDRALSDLAK
jgi:ATP-dependent DNA helicase RecQ